MPSSILTLDHGYVNYVEHHGSDERIIEAARMSTDKGFQAWGYYSWKCPACGYHTSGTDVHVWTGLSVLDGDTLKCPNDGVYLVSDVKMPGDEKLLRYLYEHHHTTPFEMAGATFEVQAPILVFREWHRHRTLSYNELSARYTTLPDLYYVPSVERLQNAVQSKTNRQASASGHSLDFAHAWQQFIITQTQLSRQAYEKLLEAGVSREVARVVIPVNQYSRMRVSGNLLNWIRFLRLRCEASAQWEIRQYANNVRIHLESLFPRTLALVREELG